MGSSAEQELTLQTEEQELCITLANSWVPRLPTQAAGGGYDQAAVDGTRTQRFLPGSTSSLTSLTGSRHPLCTQVSSLLMATSRCWRQKDEG